MNPIMKSGPLPSHPGKFSMRCQNNHYDGTASGWRTGERGAVYRRGKTYWVRFRVNGHHVRARHMPRRNPRQPPSCDTCSQNMPPKRVVIVPAIGKRMPSIVSFMKPSSAPRPAPAIPRPTRCACPTFEGRCLDDRHLIGGHASKRKQGEVRDITIRCGQVAYPTHHLTNNAPAERDTTCQNRPSPPARWCLPRPIRLRLDHKVLETWRTRRDSNARPSPSEQFNLPFDAFRWVSLRCAMLL